MGAAGDDYVMTVGLSTSTDEELLYVIDVRSSRMVVYRFNTNRLQIELVQGIDLAQLRDRGHKPSTGNRRRRP